MSRIYTISFYDANKNLVGSKDFTETEINFSLQSNYRQTDGVGFYTTNNLTLAQGLEDGTYVSLQETMTLGQEVNARYVSFALKEGEEAAIEVLPITMIQEMGLRLGSPDPSGNNPDINRTLVGNFIINF